MQLKGPSPTKTRRSTRTSALQLQDARAFDSFCSAYLSNQMTALALDGGDNSIQGKRLDKYLKLVHRKAPVEKVPDQLPFEIEALISMQNTEGRWEDPARVRELVDADADLTLGVGLDEWEVATALALAYIRQRVEYAAVLEPLYSRARGIVSEELIGRAVEGLLYGSTDLAMTPLTVAPTKSSCSTAVTAIVPLETSAAASTAIVIAKVTSPAPLLRRSPDSTSKTDVCLVSLLLALDSVLLEAKQRLGEASQRYRAATTHTAKAFCFEECIASLGNGTPPCTGAAGWRGRGVCGVRAAVSTALCLLYDEAAAQHGGAGRVMSFAWNGGDVSAYLAASTDFVHSSPELREHLGNRFRFLGNPLMLPVDAASIRALLTSYFSSYEHCLSGEGGDWQERHRFRVFKDHMYSLFTCNRRAEWPDLPSMDAKGFRGLLKALHVLEITYGRDSYNILSTMRSIAPYS